MLPSVLALPGLQPAGAAAAGAVLQAAARRRCCPRLRLRVPHHGAAAPTVWVRFQGLFKGGRSHLCAGAAATCAGHAPWAPYSCLPADHASQGQYSARLPCLTAAVLPCHTAAVPCLTSAVPPCLTAAALQVRQLEALVRLSEALARLHLSETVTRDHVKEASWDGGGQRRHRGQNHLWHAAERPALHPT